MAPSAPRPVKVLLPSSACSVLAVGLLTGICLCLVGAAIGLLLCMAMTILLFTVDTALWAATSALEACIPLLIRGATIHFKPPNLATEMLRPPCPNFCLQPLTDKPDAACSPPCSEQNELIKSWSRAPDNQHPGSSGKEVVTRNVTPKTSPRTQAEEIKGPDTPAATQQLFTDGTSTKGSLRPDADTVQDVDCASQTPSAGMDYDRELDGGFEYSEVNESILELAAEVMSPNDVSAVAAVAAVAEIQQPATQSSTDFDCSFDLIMFGSEAEEAEKLDSAQPLTPLKNQPGLPVESGRTEAVLLAPDTACTLGPAKPTTTSVMAKAPSKTIKGKKVLEAVRLLENRAKTGGPTRDSVLQKVMPERNLATKKGRGQHSVRKLSLQIDKRTDCMRTVLPMPPTAHALCSAAASSARWNRQSSGKFCCR